MKKSIVILLVNLCLWSCSDSEKTQVLTKEVQSLRSRNDSLKEILREVNQKYVFDRFTARYEAIIKQSEPEWLSKSKVED